MPDILVVCDRCGEEILGNVFLEADGSVGGTAGFYQTETGYWTSFVDLGEKIICDECMWNGPRYLEVYPKD